LGGCIDYQKGVQTTSQVSHPCYTANTQLEDEESQEGNASPTKSDFIVETAVDPQLCTIRKPFKIDFDWLQEDFELKSNLERKKVYKERFNVDQKKGILSHFKKHISEIEMHISYFDFVDEFYPVENQVQTISKEKWVKEDNTVISSSHPPQETIVFQHRTTTVKASPFKVASENTDVKKVIEQANYTNQYLNSIGNQLDKIEEKLDNKPLPKERHKPFKQEKPIVKFPDLKSGTSLKINKEKPFIDKIEDMLKDLVKPKQEQPSSSNTLSVTKIAESSETESSSESESDENIRKVEKAFSALELNRIHKPKFSPTSFTKNWYPRPTPPDIQFEERNFQSQFAVSADKLYEWNIDGLAEQQILDKLTHMTMVSSSYVMNHNLSQPEVVDLLVKGFTGTLQSWWEKHLTDESRASIRSAVKTNEEGIPIFNEKIGLGDSDAVNTLFYTIVEHFIGTPSHLASRVHDQLSNLRCPTLSDFRWYKDVFLSKAMLREDSNQPFWKEKFINGLPHSSPIRSKKS
jgi:hypothetical protein